MPERKLSIGKISELTTGSSDEFKSKVNEMDLTLNDLRALKEAESSGKGREDILEFIDQQITFENVGAYLGLANEDVGELKDVLNEIERVEDIEHFDEKNISIDQDKLIDLVGGTVDELKEFVNGNPLTAEQIENVLNAEQRVKDRKTAKAFLEKKIEKRRIGQDVEEAKDDLEKLKSDLEHVRNDKGLEKQADQEEDSESGSEDTVEDKTEEELEEGGSQETEQASGEDSEKDSEKEEGDDSKEENESEEEGSEEESEEESDESENEKDEEDEKSDEEKKREIVEELGLEMDEKEIEQFSLKDLEKIRSEKQHREELIDKLEDQGMEEDDLRESSTEDLEKIAESLDEKEESREEHEEMREEAEEDLEMLMGAVRWDDEAEEEDDSKSTKEKIEDMKQNIRSKLKRSKKSSGSSDGRIKSDKVSEILDQYRELDNEEAAIKTSHIMKGFLENNLGIEREMTYKELAENMPTENEDMHDLAEFFIQMHREQYTGKMEIDDSDEIIDTCEKVLKKLS